MNNGKNVINFVTWMQWPASYCCQKLFLITPLAIIKIHLI